MKTNNKLAVAGISAGFFLMVGIGYAGVDHLQASTLQTTAIEAATSNEGYGLSPCTGVCAGCSGCTNATAVVENDVPETEETVSLQQY